MREWATGTRALTRWGALGRGSGFLLGGIENQVQQLLILGLVELAAFPNEIGSLQRNESPNRKLTNNTRHKCLKISLKRVMNLLYQSASTPGNNEKKQEAPPATYHWWKNSESFFGNHVNFFGGRVLNPQELMRQNYLSINIKRQVVSGHRTYPHSQQLSRNQNLGCLSKRQ